jgi:hypothetical protein
MEALEYLRKQSLAWARDPYNEDHDLFQWFLTIGALTAVTILWTRVIRQLVD